MKCHRGCDNRLVIDVLRRAGCWDVTDKLSVTSSTANGRRHREEETHEYVLKLWRDAQPITDTLAETYLRHRGIAGPLPRSLRFSVLKHSGTGLYLPTMLGAVQGPDRQITGLQRTFLRGDGTGKAAVASPRMMLGKVRGGAVRLAAAEREIAIGEGLETCLSYQRAMGISTWAALSAEGIKGIVLPPLPLAGMVHLLVDLDPAGEASCAAAAERLSREVPVRQTLPPRRRPRFQRCNPGGRFAR